jgi:RNA polymerase sigma-70 factor (ECF subfamily)
VTDQPNTRAEDLERFRPYLLCLARAQSRGLLRSKLDPEDVVQQALLKAYAGLDQFRGEGDGQMLAWLRTILANVLKKQLRYLTQQKRDPALERSLEASIEDSSARLEAFLAADQSSPSERLRREEESIRITAALAQLPEDQRTAVERRHLHGETLDAISQGMGLTKRKVTGLLRQGLERLREILAEK